MGACLGSLMEVIYSVFNIEGTCGYIIILDVPVFISLGKGGGSGLKMKVDFVR